MLMFFVSSFYRLNSGFVHKKERELSLSDYCPINTPTSSANGLKL
nr:MAG TPA: hypothetical protein [Bacteriophage sp.]